MARERGPPSVPQLLALLALLGFVAARAHAFCPVRCVCNDDKLTVQCAGAALDVIPITLNPEIRELHLTRNNIKNILSAFSVYQQLESLDVSYNQLRTLGRGNFPLAELKVLLLDNNAVVEVEADTFKGLRGLLELQMRRNGLADVPSRAFHDMRSLERLDLSQNQISRVDPDAFVGLHRLKSLVLRENRLSHIPTPAFHHIPHLLALDVAQNPIPTVVENAFSHLVRLRELVMERCNTAILEPGCFSSLVSLSSLRLQDNALAIFPAEALSDLHRLEELHIGRNGFRSLTEEHLRALENLKRLHIIRAESLEIVDELAFSQSTQLEQIVLEDNKRLTFLAPGTFSNLRQLTRVSLRGNGIESFHPDLLPWNQLASFDIRDNPLVCNCSVIWLWDLLRALDHNGNWTNVRCHSPPHLSQELLRSLSHYDLDCDGHARRNILIVGLSTTAIFAIIVLALVLWYRRKVSSVLKKQMDTTSLHDPHMGQFHKSESVMALPPAAHVTYNGKFRPTPLAYI
ncbi:leucine-rich repeat-containing protein 4C [Ixodes scapularis]|uniref:leucine-rich repeat-containing protein 4C n=1 Tax=Ixodes scapularis TaxID=6945 RepID=UPI001A9F54D1|nr:leucine-rich repeat-containing protein 4C [Ixodes scapularis]